MSDKQYPNGLAEAISRIKQTDPDMGPTKLAKLTKMNKQTVDRYIKWDRKLTVLNAQKLAPYLGVSPKELMFSEPDLPGVQRVPLISWVSAGKLAGQEGVRNIDAKKHVVAADLPKGDWIALRVEGDSMDRVAPDGSIIFVNRADDNLKDDHFYVFALATGETTFKRFRGGKPPRLQPFSTSPDFETIHAPDGVHVIGRVRRVLTDLR